MDASDILFNTIDYIGNEFSNGEGFLIKVGNNKNDFKLSFEPLLYHKLYKDYLSKITLKLMSDESMINIIDFYFSYISNDIKNIKSDVVDCKNLIVFNDNKTFSFFLNKKDVEKLLNMYLNQEEIIFSLHGAKNIEQDPNKFQHNQIIEKLIIGISKEEEKITKRIYEDLTERANINNLENVENKQINNRIKEIFEKYNNLNTKDYLNVSLFVFEIISVYNEVLKEPITSNKNDRIINNTLAYIFKESNITININDFFDFQNKIKNQINCLMRLISERYLTSNSYNIIYKKIYTMNNRHWESM